MEEADQLLITTLGHLGLQLPEKKVFYSHLLKFFSAFDIAGKYRKFLSVLKLQANIGALGPDLIVQAVVLCLHRSLTSTLKTDSQN